MIWKPQPKQALALSANVDELFFGGARGGGKTDLMIAAFTRYIGYGDKYDGIIFRRTLNEQEEIVKRSKQIYPHLGGTWRSGDRTWVFNTGSTLKLRYMEDDRDIEKYQGHSYQFIGWDELPNWPNLDAYKMMKGTLRGASSVPKRIVATGNPGGVGHLAVKEYFIDVAPPYEIFVEEYEDDNGRTFSMKRVFIPSTLDDNEELMTKDPKYQFVLKSMAVTDELYRAWRYGDWSVVQGSIFHELDKQKHMFEPFPIPQSWHRFMSMDWGMAKPFSIGFWAVDEDGRLWRYKEWYGNKDIGEYSGPANKGIDMDAKVVARKLVGIADTDILVADPACWSKHGHGTTIINAFVEAGFTPIKGINEHWQGLQAIKQRLKEEHNGRPMMMISSACHDFWRTVPVLQSDPNKPEDVNTKMEDHVYDEVRYAVMSSQALALPSTMLYSNKEYNPMEGI